MPYIDQGEPQPTSIPPILPIAAVVVAMFVGVGLFWVFHQAGLHPIIPLLITGPLIGLALRLTGRGYVPKAGTMAVVAAMIACLVGYVFRHVVLITWVDGFGNPLDPQPGVGNAFQWLFSSDIASLLCIGMSAYFAFAIAGAIPYAVGEKQQ